MTRQISTLVLFLLVFTLAAQPDWQPFPTNQPTYWRTDTLLYLHSVDSVVVSGSITTHYFGAKHYLAEVDSPCFDSIVQVVTQGAGLPMQVCTSIADTWYFTAASGQVVAFKPHTALGAWWDVPLNGPGFDLVRFTCVSVGEQNFLGITDSVKTFATSTWLGGTPVSTPANQLQYRLSKNRGFIEYVPFEQLTDAYPESRFVEGITAQGQRFGFTNDFLDFHGHYAAGQVYKYKTFAWTGIGHDITQRDSVLSAQITTDQVRVDFDFARTDITSQIIGGSFPNFILDYDTTYQFGTYTKIWKRSDYPEFKLLPNWFNHTALRLVRPEVRGQHDDWLFNWEEESFGLMNAIDSCASVFFDGYIGPVVHSSRFGLFYQNQTSLGPPRYFELIGYKDNLDAWGNYDRIVSVRTPELATLIKLYPQPATQTITLDLPDQLSLAKLHYRICTQDGTTVQTAALQDKQIDVTGLGSGSYVLILQMEGNSHAMVKRFVKM